MQITIDTNNLSDLDLAMLAMLAAPAPAAKKPAETTPTPTVTAVPEPEPEDLVGGMPTMSDAVAAATVLVSNGGAAKVKEALAACGSKRVSELKTEDIPAFLAALQA